MLPPCGHHAETGVSNAHRFEAWGGSIASRWSILVLALFVAAMGSKHAFDGSFGSPMKSKDAFEGSFGSPMNSKHAFRMFRCDPLLLKGWLRGNN